MVVAPVATKLRVNCCQVVAAPPAGAVTLKLPAERPLRRTSTEAV